jgi:alanine dehydrogenase
LQLTDCGLEALESDPALAKGVNIQAGRIVHPAIAATFPDLPSISAKCSSMIVDC